MNVKAMIAAWGLVTLGLANTSFAGGGPLGIDHKLELDESGIWKRSNQTALLWLTVGGNVGAALWEGSDTRFGKTSWQAIDATIVGQAGYLILNNTFRRLRPSQTDDPNQWFKSGGHSFPSGEVTAISSVITPFVFEYRDDHPGVYALELLPLYDAVARMKSQAHWQTDVLAGWAIGTAVGYDDIHSRGQSFTVRMLPRGITVGWHKKF